MENILSNNILDLIENINLDSHKMIYKKFDCVISGGALKGYYNFGTCKILTKLHDNNNINIRKFVCVSSGAIIMVCLLCNMSLLDSSKMYNKIQNVNTDLHDSVITVLNEILPNNAHELCENKLNIVLSKITNYGFESETITTFMSRKYLIDVLSASIYLPLFTTTHITGIKINNNYYFDGWFVKNVPIIYNNDLPQLVIRTYKIDYNPKHIFTLTDNCPELLIIKGALEMEQFICGVKILDKPFKWHLKNDIIHENMLYANIITFLMALFINLLIYIKKKLNINEL